MFPIASHKILGKATTLIKLSLFMLFFSFASVQAQVKSIASLKGIVKNEAGELLSGATITVQGTKLITTTKKDGSFELKDIPEESTLRISYVGHTPELVKLKAGQTSVNLVLNRTSNMLGEVVVNTGLYKRPVGNFTGAAKTYSGEELKSINPTNVLQALAAVDPSVRIEQNNALGSDPNQLPIIQIRGENNLPVVTQGGANATATPVSNGDFMSSYLLNPNQPLIILDGFQTSLQTLYDLDINRIANITVLKDAAATAAYGSKAANGVLVIDTKQPSVGRVQVSYAINASMDVVDLSSYHLLDAAGYLEAQRLAGVYSDPINHFNDLALKQWYDYRKYQVESGVNTYWLSQPVRNGFGLNHSLNLSGGSRSIRYSLSLNYSNAEGVMKGSNRNRAGVNYNLAYTSKNIRFSNTSTLGYSRSNNSPWGSYSSYTTQAPYFKPYDSVGNPVKILEPSYLALGISIPAPGGTLYTNAAYDATLDSKNYSYYTSFVNNSNFEWSITRDLRMRANFSYASNLPGGEAYYPADHTIFANAVLGGFSDMGSYSQTRGRNNVLDGRLSFDYIKRMDRHTFLASLGASAQQTKSTSTTVNVSGLPNDYLDELAMAAGYGTSIKPNSSNNITRSLSTYSSVSYNYADRYTAEITLNASGSSQFGSNNRLAPFWAAGAGWNIDKEKFFNKNSIIQQLRVRATTGVTGNQNFSAHMSQPTFQYNILNNYRLQLGANVENYVNPDLKWQQTLKNNIGVQMGLFNGGLNISFDIYSEKTDNLILPLDVAPSTGFVNYQDNLGATKNSGYEISISAPIIRNRKKNIFWTVSFNAGHYENVITKLSPAIEALNKANNSSTTKQNAPLPRFEVGQSMSRIWAVKSLGIDPATGKEIFVKLDGSQTFTWDPNDKVPCGDATSKIKGMIGSSFTYKGFGFNITLAYNYGGQMYNQTLVDKIENVNLYLFNADERVLTQRWKKPGDQVSFKSLVANGASGLQLTNATSRFVQDNNYIDASSITIGYTFPTNLNWVRTLHLSTPRIFITQNNVFHIGTIKTERGTSYPFARSFNFGLSTTF